MPRIAGVDILSKQIGVSQYLYGVGPNNSKKFWKKLIST
jgi:hypothetical protein